jgi:hypothetical protein
METSLIDIKLSIEKKDNSIVANLFFYNSSPEKLYLEKQTIYFDNEVRNNYFEIFDEKETEVDYTGIMAKRLISQEDFIELKPGESIKSSIPLDKYYELNKGSKYIIKYFAFNPSYLKEQSLMQMQSNPVEITY